jgi:hypothetical protein
MHKDLREIWLALDRATAETAIGVFAEKYAFLGFKIATLVTSCLISSSNKSDADKR